MENDDGQRNKGSSAAAANTHIRFVLQSANRNEINERKSIRDGGDRVRSIVALLIQPGILIHDNYPRKSFEVNKSRMSLM